MRVRVNPKQPAMHHTHTDEPPRRLPVSAPGTRPPYPCRPAAPRLPQVLVVDRASAHVALTSDRPILTVLGLPDGCVAVGTERGFLQLFRRRAKDDHDHYGEGRRGCRGEGKGREGRGGKRREGEAREGRERKGLEGRQGREGKGRDWRGWATDGWSGHPFILPYDWSLYPAHLQTHLSGIPVCSHLLGDACARVRPVGVAGRAHPGHVRRRSRRHAAVHHCRRRPHLPVQPGVCAGG